jgi:hypothetical protein
METFLDVFAPAIYKKCSNFYQEYQEIMPTVYKFAYIWKDSHSILIVLFIMRLNYTVTYHQFKVVNTLGNVTIYRGQSSFLFRISSRAIC